MISTARIFAWGAGATALAAIGWLLLVNRQLSQELQRSRIEIGAARAHASVERYAPARPASSPARPTDKRPVETTNGSVPVHLQLWAAPGQRAAQLDRAMLDVERDYGRFFFESTRGWPAARVEALKRQIALNRVAEMRALVPRTFPVTAARRAEQQQALQATRADNERQLRALLGEADYAQLNAFEKTTAYSGIVAGLADAMRAKGVDLTAQTERVILSAYSNAVQQAAAAAGQVDPAQLTDEERAAFRSRQRDTVQRELLRQLSGRLDANQLDALLESSLEQEDGGS